MTHPHPDFWYPIAALLSAMRKLLRATAPDGFAAIARDARAQLAAITALVRRYIHVLAAEIVLPPLRPRGNDPAPAPGKGSARASRYAFPLIETPSVSHGGSTGEDPPALQWALLVEAAGRLAAVMADPASHARRLARRFGTLLVQALRDLPVPRHITRRLPPWLDVFICKLDAAARPEAWAGLEMDSS